MNEKIYSMHVVLKQSVIEHMQLQQDEKWNLHVDTRGTRR
jgi:hypothetical protein